MMENKKLICFCILGIMAILSAASFASAGFGEWVDSLFGEEVDLGPLDVANGTEFRVASQYYENRPLEVYPGQTASAIFLIRNNVLDKGEISVEVSFLEDLEIASLVEKGPFSIDFGKEAKIEVKVEVPDRAPIGDEYDIKMLFKSSNGEINREFKIIVVEESQEVKDARKSASFNIATWFFVGGIVLVVVILVIIWLVVKKNKHKANMSFSNMPNI